jgi:hypothetical protein
MASFAALSAGSSNSAARRFMIKTAIERLQVRDHPELAAHPRELELVTGFIEGNLQKTVTLVDRLNTF